MKKHKTWYNRKLFKKHFKSYAEWDDFNPPSGEKQQGRYKSDVLRCRNENCPREGMFISEHEAFYYAARKSSFTMIRKKIKRFILRRENKNIGSDLYVCPFCGEDDIEGV